MSKQNKIFGTPSFCTTMPFNPFFEILLVFRLLHQVKRNKQNVCNKPRWPGTCSSWTAVQKTTLPIFCCKWNPFRTAQLLGLFQEDGLNINNKNKQKSVQHDPFFTSLPASSSRFIWIGFPSPKMVDVILPPFRGKRGPCGPQAGNIPSGPERGREFWRMFILSVK